MKWLSVVGQSLAGQARSGITWRGTLRRGRLRLGRYVRVDIAGCCVAWHGVVGLVRLVKCWEQIVMTYKWKETAVSKLDAQIVGEELLRISEVNNRLTPEIIVNESRDSSAILHNEFDWNDETAAESWRKQQARILICSITVVNFSSKVSEPVRAFVHIHDNYEPISVVVNSSNMMDSLLETALKELISFQRKYSALSKLKPVIDAIGNLFESDKIEMM